MAKINLINISTLTPSASAVSALNENVAEIKRAMDTMLSRDGQGPNYMEAELDMNSQKILNVADPEENHDAVNLETMQEAIAGALFDGATVVIEGDATIRTDLASGLPGYGANLVAYDSGTTVKDRIDNIEAGVGGDPTLRADLASSAVGDGAEMVGYSATETVKQKIVAVEADIAAVEAGIDDTLRTDLAASTGAELVKWLPSGSGGVAQPVVTALREFVRPEHYGAVGDGVTDDYAALVACQAAAAGRDILLKSGKTYRINSALVFTTNTSIRTDGAKKAVLYHAGQSFVPLTITGSSPGSQFLTADVTLHSRAWKTGVVNPATVGQLMTVKSSASWYHDPRPTSTDARKSELHKIVAVVGDTIYTEDGANDGYDIPAETVTLEFFNPVKVVLSNIEVKCDLPPVGVGAAAKSGIELIHCDSPLVLNVDVTGAAGKGIGLTTCYRPLVDGGHTRSANNYGTGYGVQTAGTAHAVIRNRSAWECRRCVDVSGAQIISRNTLVEGCTAFGGGINSEGTVYGWTDAAATGAYQGGFGSHGAADHTTYRGNVSANLHTHYNCRGRNEIIEDNYMIGRSRNGLIAVSYGENLIVRGNTAYDGRLSMKTATVYDGGGNIHTRRADYFVSFYDSYEGRAVGQVVIEDNYAMVQNAFIYCLTGTFTAVPQNLTLRNNKVSCATSGGTTEVYLVYNAHATLATPSGWIVQGNDIDRSAGTGRVNYYFNIDPRNSTDTFSSGRSYNLYMDDDTATSIKVPNSSLTNGVRVIVDAGYDANGSVLVTEGSTFTGAFGTPNDISCATTGVLTGITGTDANLNLSMQDGKLYVENRLGVTRRIILTILHSS